MYIKQLTKADGRALWLYGLEPVLAEPLAALPPVPAASHMRWHPLAQEWVLYAAHRQDRTFLPLQDPLAPTIEPTQPTELPRGRYEVAVFENRFPSMNLHPQAPPAIAAINTAAAKGRCEVIVYSQDDRSFADLSTAHATLILEAMAHRTDALGREGLQYVLIFENRGVEMGVTLNHPHGQIYAYPFLPGHQKTALDAQRAYYANSGTPLVSDLVKSECSNGTRVVCRADKAISFAPPFARFPYELWIVPHRSAPRLDELSVEERRSVACLLQDAQRRLDALFGSRMPYLMSVNQAPCDGQHPEWTLRIEIWPIRRAATKLKYLAGTELAAGVFANDVEPERAAEKLRRASP